MKSFKIFRILSTTLDSGKDMSAIYNLITSVSENTTALLTSNLKTILDNDISNKVNTENLMTQPEKMS
jgi:hypothetical protein